MPASPSGFYVNPVLAGVAAGYASGLEGFAGPLVFPFVSATKQEGVIFSNDPNREFQRIANTVRGPGGYYPEAEFDSPARLTYNCIDHSLSSVLADEYVKQSDPEARGSYPTVERLVEMLMLKFEVETVAELTTLSQTGVPGTKWDNAAGSIISDVKKEKETIRKSVGRDPNIIVLSPRVLDRITETPDFKDRAKYTMTPEQQRTAGKGGVLAAVLEIEKVIIASRYYNSAARGQTPVMASIWDENVLLAFAENPRSTDVRGSQALGMTVTWDAAPEGVSGGWYVATERENKRKGEAHYVTAYYNHKLLNPGAGYLFTDVLT